MTHVDLTQAFCILQRAPQPAKCPPSATGDPYGYVFDAQGVQNVVFRATDGHVHGFWRTSQGRGDDNLTGLANAPKAAGNPQAYAFPAQGFHNVVYRDGKGHVHRLHWTTAAVGDDDLTVLSNVLASNSSATAAGDPFGYIIPFQGFQNVLYKGKDGHLHGLYWSNGPVGHDDLTKESGAPPPAGDLVRLRFTLPRAFRTPSMQERMGISTGCTGPRAQSAMTTSPQKAGPRNHPARQRRTSRSPRALTT